MTARLEKREIGNLIMEGVPPIPVKIGEQFDRYQNNQEVIFADWLEGSDSMLVKYRAEETDQFHLLQGPVKEKRQLTFFKEPVFSGMVRPKANSQPGFLFLKDIGGSELFQIFFYDLESNTSRMLTDGTSKNGEMLWAPDGSSFVYTSTKRDNIHHDLYLYDFEQQEEHFLFRGKGLWYPIDWSDDGKWISLLNYRSIDECPLYLYHLDGEELYPIIPTGNSVACRSGIWAKHGRGLYFSTDVESSFRQLAYYDIEQQSYRILQQDSRWDIEQMSLSTDGIYLAFSYNENGWSKLFVMDTASETMLSIALPEQAQIVNMNWKAGEHKLALTINTPIAPNDIYVYDCEKDALEQWTFSESETIQYKDFIIPNLIHYPSFDQVGEEYRHIPAFYFRPAHRENKKLPVLIYIHGGPESQFRPSFSPIFQYYLKELGVAVIAPNVRGSTGYGKEYLELDNGYKREDSVKDIGKLLEWISRQEDLDANRVAVMGGSYGGYMVLASMTHFNEQLKCGIDIVGISNFVTFLKNTKSYRRNLRRVEYGDERDPEMRKHLEQISPANNAHKITKPMLIVQGLNDPRVPVSEAEQMLRAIRRNGGEVWYLLAKDEGHGFRKKSNRETYSKAAILFLENYLLG